MALTKQDKIWTEETIIKGVVGGLNEVMIPAMEDMEERLGDKINAVDLKLTKMLDHHSNKLDEHEERIQDLEEKRKVILN